MLFYPKDKTFLTVIKVEVPFNIQGLGNADATPVKLPLGDQYEGRKIKVNAQWVQASNETSPQKPHEIEETKENRDDIDLMITSETVKGNLRMSLLFDQTIKNW